MDFCKLLSNRKLERVEGLEPSWLAWKLESFHTCGLIWTAAEYVAYVDREEVFRTKEGVSHQSPFAVFSLFSADWEVSRLDRSRLPDSLIEDYVRVYDPTPSVGVVPEKN